ncbi:ATP-binding protein [Nocardia farcinica]|uniref:ATP-binding protein n=1 Tax=Nocardia farcinica TaxID=37329 RepID=UPI00189345EF|nr:ATP-binding protein [Nocardia farcinica]MBF6253981.1 ATP-binding protein [Nocardia farcinica]MBF6265518.1 ATP-binding protein [Nocardia farcinica]MBF6284119.1 ATP-binding protein [Nocardia farcinica]MBF6308153.1 ATP-binding protein [Nocardia farcinica]MBF6511602.1 ATP-binding protein [Nocardia farcinica]
MVVVWARERGLPDELVGDIDLVVYEAVANVVVHAYPDGCDGTMTVSTGLESGALVVSVADARRWPLA